MNDDRTVHGYTARGGDEIVRYNRAGKWYRERPNGRGFQITVSEAAHLLATPGSIWRRGLPGGGRLDTLVARRRAHFITVGDPA